MAVHDNALPGNRWMPDDSIRRNSESRSVESGITRGYRSPVEIREEKRRIKQRQRVEQALREEQRNSDEALIRAANKTGNTTARMEVGYRKVQRQNEEARRGDA